MKEIEVERGACVQIPVAQLEFHVGGNTIWVHSPQGGTVLRVCLPQGSKISVNNCPSSPISHADVNTKGPVEICLAGDADYV